MHECDQNISHAVHLDNRFCTRARHTITGRTSKIPVALLIAVNCLLYTASFQIRFCRCSPGATDKSNCDSSRYRCARHCADMYLVTVASKRIERFAQPLREEFRKGCAYARFFSHLLPFVARLCVPFSVSSFASYAILYFYPAPFSPFL